MLPSAPPSHTQEQALLDFFHLVRIADRLEPLLPAGVRPRVNDLLHELGSRLQEALVGHLDPRTLDEVRRFEPCLRGQGLIYLLERAAAEQWQGVPAWKRDRWCEWLYDFDEQGQADVLLADPEVRTVPDVAAWLLRHERHLFPDISDEDNQEDN